MSTTQSPIERSGIARDHEDIAAGRLREAKALQHILDRPQDVEEASTGSLPHLDAELVLLRLRDKALLDAERSLATAIDLADRLLGDIATGALKLTGDDHLFILDSAKVDAWAETRRRVVYRLHELGFSSADYIR